MLYNHILASFLCLAVTNANLNSNAVEQLTKVLV